MSRPAAWRAVGGLGRAAAVLLATLLVLPVAALVVFGGPLDIAAGMRSATFVAAIRVSLVTSAVALSAIVAGGTPLAWWLARARRPWASVVEVLVDLPLVLPPAVLGVALLATFGRNGIFGPALGGLGVAAAFTPAAVVIAQVVVAAPFYIRAATTAFRAVDPDLFGVARTLGAGPVEAFVRVVVPCSRRALVAGAALTWARALGELGATLLFAGSLPGRTQTMPVAILSAFEADVRVAVALSLTLLAIGAVTLAALHRLGRGADR
ncbi:MAG: molybdate ABC transporter permease subunit [Myxococcales bacterium]|nr:molybdate ABC transporter permease subunit [Myxococcales bacterium]